MGSDSHTPGPWIVSVQHHTITVYFEGIEDGPGFKLVAIASEHGSLQREEAKANARLIAAAPCMKEALKAASHALRSYQYGNASTELAKAIADKCDAALSRATKGGDDDEG